MSITIYSDSYAPHGTIITGPQEKPEPPREDPQADILRQPDLCKTLKTAADRLDFWYRWNMPKAAGRIRTGRDTWEPFWSRRKILRWLEEARELAAAVERIP